MMIKLHCLPLRITLYDEMMTMMASVKSVEFIHLFSPLGLSPSTYLFPVKKEYKLRYNLVIKCLISNNRAAAAIVAADGKEIIKS